MPSLIEGILHINISCNLKWNNKGQQSTHFH